MRKIIFFFTILFLCCFHTAHSYEFMDDWNARDTSLQALFTAITVVDWMQTRTMAGNDWMLDGEPHHEMNPLLGRHPSQGRVDAMIGLGILGHTLVAMFLPSKTRILHTEIHPRTIWQSFFICVEAGAVGNNYNAGIRIEF